MTPEQEKAAIEAMLRGYATEKVLERRREKADRDEIHPGDVGVDVEGDIRVTLSFLSQSAMTAAFTVLQAFLKEQGLEIREQDDDR